MKNLSGRTVLITGAARGIGRETAAQFGRRGCRLVLVDIDEEGMAAAAAGLGELGIEVSTVKADLLSPGAAEDIVNRALELNGRIDVLVNNAGIVYGGPVTELSEEKIERTVRVNLMAPILTTRQAILHMKRRGSGHIVNICSISGWTAPPNVSVYSATKAGLIAFTDSVMQELHGTGIRTTVVSPNFVSTDMFAGCRSHPLWRWTTPEEVASKVVLAVEKGHSEVYVPRLMWLWAIFRAALKARLAYFMGRLARADRITAGWKGECAPSSWRDE